MPQQPAEPARARPLVHVLVSEAFFRSRIVDTLNALVLRPEVTDLGAEFEALVETVASAPAQGAVVDLEDEGHPMVELVARLRADPRTADWHWLCYCAPESEELVADAARQGLEAVPRSTFASSLVRLLQAFEPADEA